MTGVAVQQSATWSRQEHIDQQQQLACFEPTSASPRHSVMDAWLRKLRLHHHHKDSSNAYASPSASSAMSSSPVCESSQQQQKRKHPSFIKALFKPHEHKAIKNSSPEAKPSSSNDNNSSSKDSKKKHSRHHPEKRSSNQTLDQQEQQESQSERVVPPVEIPSMYLGRNAAPGGVSGCSVTVGGRRVPFTRDAHRRMMKKRAVKALACIAEARAFGSSNKDAYRSLAYYPAPPKQQRKEKR